MPHPIYAWMSWVQILSPSRDKFEEVFPLIEEAHQEAVKKFEKKTANNRVAAEQ
jgi:predicted DNA-binding protein (MmcQ/YjbR family)